MPPKATVRDRKRPDILSFEPGFKQDSKYARYDKISLSVELGWIYTTDMKAIHNAFARIGKESPLFRNDGSEEWPVLAIRKRSDTLFGGEIRIYQKHTKGRIKAHITLNPTRYFANNPSGRQDISKGNSSPIRSHGPSSTKAKSEALDGRDNLITAKRLAKARDADWNAILAELLSEATIAIRKDIEKYAPKKLFHFHPRGIQNWTVQSAEIYWEYRTPNAPLLAESFSQHAANYFRRHRQRMHLKEVDVDGTTSSYIFDTKRQNVSIALYAKTEDRIRVECRFKSYPKVLYPKLLNDDLYPKSNVEALFEMMTALTRKAKAEIAPLLEAHESFKPKRPTAKAQMIRTLAALAWMAGQNEIMLERIFQSLLLTGRVSEGSNKGYNAILDKMAQRGLISPYPKRAKKPREYAPAEPLKSILKSVT